MNSHFFHSHSRLGSLLCVPVLSLGMAMAQQPPTDASTIYTITDLGTLGGLGSESRALNNQGEVVGDAPIKDGNSHAFLWQNGKMADLGTLPGYASSVALGINDKGQVVGYLSTGSGFNGGDRHAFLWENGHMALLGSPGSIAVGINNQSQVIGQSAAADGTTHGYVWQDGQTTDLGTLPGFQFGRVSAINNKGQVLGTVFRFSDAATHLFLWQYGEMTDLGTFKDYTAVPGAINDNGQVAGAAFSVPDGSVAEALLWQNGTFTDLGRIGGPYAYVSGINNSGQIAGSAQDIEDDDFHLFVAQGKQFINLTPLIFSASGWNLGSGRFIIANGINNSGQIVGSALHNGYTRAFLLTPKPTVDATLQISPSPFTFGAYARGQTSEPGAISIYNSGPQAVDFATIQLSGGNAQDFAITQNTCGATLAANTGCTVTLTFTPATGGERTTSLVLNDTAKSGPRTVAISGVGMGHALQFSRLSWQFPIRQVLETSGSYVEYIYNPASPAVHFTSIQFEGPEDFAFAITRNTCGSTLAPYTTCAVGFNFTPSAGGGLYKASLVFTDDANESPQVVSVSGVGSVSGLQFARSVWQFPTRRVGETSGSYVVYVYNPGTQAVPINGIYFRGVDARDFAITRNTCGSALVPYTTCGVAFNFTPTAPGERTSELVFDAGQYGNALPVSGFAVAK
jgi:probable HAF family extracellular repeat protein